MPAPPSLHVYALPRYSCPCGKQWGDGVMDELIEKLEALTEPCRLADEVIADALFERSHFAQLADAPIPTGCMMWWQDGHQQSALRYTSSLDAAITLVPKGWNLSICDDLDGVIAELWTDTGHAYAHAATRPIALCSVALKARCLTPLY